jgi:hypothetical protein
MEQNRRTAGIGLVAVVAAMVAISFSGGGLGDIFSSGASGEDQKKLDTIERLQASLRTGATADEAKALLADAGLTYQMDEQSHRLLAMVDRIRWDPHTSESMKIEIAMEDGLVGTVEFKSVHTDR